MTRAEFHKGLKGWLYAKRSEYDATGSIGHDEARHKWGAIDELIAELDKSTGFENRFPWETSLV